MPAITQEEAPAAAAAAAPYTTLSQLTTQLCVPQLFAGEQPSTSSSSSSERAYQVAAEKWTQDILPRLLEEVKRQLDLLAAEVASGEISRGAREDGVEREQILAGVIKALAKYIPPPRIDVAEGDYNSCAGKLAGSHAQGKRREEREHAVAGKDWVDPFIGLASNIIRANETLDKTCEIYTNLLSQRSSHPQPTSAKTQAHTHPPLAALSLHLLTHYLKPLFQHTSSTRVSTVTGRAVPRRAGLSGAAEAGGTWDASTAGLWDEVPWKGGDSSGEKGLEDLGRLMSDVHIHDSHGEKGKGKAGSSSKDEELLRRRHDGLGSINVLAWAVRTIASSVPSSTFPRSTSAAQLQIWEEAWPLIIPPLVTLLDDSTIISRVLGARILYYGMLLSPSLPTLDSSPDAPLPRAAPPPITLLVRTGLLPLFESSLHTSLAFITDPLSYLCLHDTLLAARQLTLQTTSAQAAAVSLSLRASGGGGAGGKGGERQKSRGVQRFEKLCALLDEGILRAWVYVPLPISSTSSGSKAAYSAKLSKLNFDPNVVVPDEDDDDMEEDGADHPNQEQADEEVHQGTATMLSLLRIAQVLFSDIGPAGCARYLDQAAEFLCALLEGWEAPLDHGDGMNGTNGAEQSTEGDAHENRVQLSLALESVRMLQVLVDACTEDYFASTQATSASKNLTSAPPPSEEGEASRRGRIFPRPLLPPNLTDRASEIVFAVATAWIKLRLVDVNTRSAATGAAADVGGQLRTAMKTLVGTLSSAIPSLEEDIRETKALDAKLQALFED